MIESVSPLNALIGTWRGDQGTDLAPRPVEDEDNPYFETLTFKAVDIEIENAETQELVAVRYHQVVTEKESGDVSHDELGYWIWNKAENAIMLVFSIPRGVSVVAEGSLEKLNGNEKGIILKVSAGLDVPNAGIVQSAFMSQNAKTTAFVREMTMSGDTLSYFQETTLKIYSKTFAHADKNILRRVKSL